MKKVLFAFISLLLLTTGFKAMAQEDKEDKKEKKKETQEIIIRKKGDKDVNINIQINGDKVTVNGKPLVEFKDDAITINKRNIIVRNGANVSIAGNDLVGLDDLGDLAGRLDAMEWEESDAKPYAFLGVTTDKTDEGTKITDITGESGAEKAGLKEGDIITKIDKEKVEDPDQLTKVIRSHKPKDEVKITYLRDGKEKTTKAILQERKSSGTFSFTGPDGSFKSYSIPSPPAMAYNDMMRQQELLSTSPRAFAYGGNDGAGAYNLSYSFGRKKLGLKIQDTEDNNGVKVLDVADSSAAATAGLKKDDIITEVGGKKVTNTDEVREQLMEMAEKSSYNIKARRNGTEMSFEIKIPKKLKTANL